MRLKNNQSKKKKKSEHIFIGLKRETFEDPEEGKSEL